MKKATNLTLGEKLKEQALRYCEKREISLSQLVQSLLEEHLAGTAEPVEEETERKPKKKR